MYINTAQLAWLDRRVLPLTIRSSHLVRYLVIICATPGQSCALPYLLKLADSGSFAHHSHFSLVGLNSACTCSNGSQCRASSWRWLAWLRLRSWYEGLSDFIFYFISIFCRV